MAAATTILAASAAAVSLGSSVSNISKGNKISDRASERLDNYQRQNLQNVYTGMAVPTQGATMQRRETQRTQAESSYLAGQMGAQGLMAAPRIADATQQSMQRIGAQIEESEFRLQQLIAEDEARIRQMREGREQQDIAGLGAERAYGQSLAQSGWQGITSTLGSAAELGMSMQPTDVSGSQYKGGRMTDPIQPQVQPWQNRVKGNWAFEGYTPKNNYQF